MSRRLALFGLTLSWMAQHIPEPNSGGQNERPLWGLGLGTVMNAPSVQVTQDEQGVYHVRLKGEFVLHLDGKVEFYKRMLIIFLYLLEMEGEHRGSRRTRDGRIPFVRREQLAQWFNVPGPSVSRWSDYWLRQDWRRLLSRRHGDVLTLETQQRIINTWVQFPWWGAERLWKHLKAQGENVPLNQVRQAARESGLSILRARLAQVYVVTAETLRPRDEWLVSQLLAQVQQLVEQLEAMKGLTPEQRVELNDLGVLSQELGLSPASTLTPLPWVLQVEQMLFGHWELVKDESVRCIYCGSTDVSRKSRQTRLKKYLDDQGQVQQVEVYRYYCRNPQCSKKSFTNLPPDLLPYSRQPLRRRLAALQIYVWNRSVYRRSGQALGLCKTTVYRWVHGFGYALLPMAALFG
jgi:hypothetical protein